MKKFVLFIVIILALGGIYFVVQKNQSETTPLQTEKTATSTSGKVFQQLPSWFPNSSWSQPQPATQETPYGSLSGMKSSTTMTTKTASVPHFGQSVPLRDMGFDVDKNLAADGAGSSQWGFTKTVDGQKKVIIFSSETKPTNSNPNEPLQFSCPCQTSLSVFVSND